MKLEGRIWKFGSDVDTDAIIPARYLNQTDAEELAKHVMEDERPEFFQEVKKGDILLAEKNFGCGSSREHAPLALKTAGISCIIAESFARIFYRNGFNQGLPLLESSEASKEINDGDLVRVDLATGEIFDHDTTEEILCKTHPGFYAGIDWRWGIDPTSSEKGAKREKIISASSATRST